MYALDSEPSFELNSKKELREKVIKIKPISTKQEEIKKGESEQIKQTAQSKDNEEISIDINKTVQEKQSDSFFNKMMKKFSEWL
jgi:hypothetical protein